MNHLIGMQIQGVKVLEHRLHQDERGSFGRIFDTLWGEAAEFHVKQINLSFSVAKGTLRGMHFQVGQAQEAKIITCLTGRVFDVVADLRTDSATFMQWCALELSEGDGQGLLIPRGCAHGFLTLEANSKLLYLHDNFHDPLLEQGVNFADPSLNIEWPGAIKVISTRDRNLPMISSEFVGI